MKRFICNILLFMLPSMSFLAIIDYFYSKAAAKSNVDEIEAWYDLMHGQIDADVLVMGNSRACFHVNPLILDSILGISTYNIGMDGSWFNRQIHKYNMFRKYNRKPRLIIQTIDHMSFKYAYGYLMEQFFPYFWNKAMRDEVLVHEPLSPWEKYVPMYRYYRRYDCEKIYNLLDSTCHKLTKGYRGVEQPWDGAGFRKLSSVVFEVNDTTVKMFDNYLAKVKNDGIKMVFVYTPHYIELNEKMENLEEMHATYKRFADKYDIPILDYRGMEICSDTTFFYNVMHLNKKGAEIFSDSLGRDLKRLGLYVK